jgi:hypothetical protein
MPNPIDLKLLDLTRGLDDRCLAAPEGRVSQVIGMTIESLGPRSSVGDTVQIWPTTAAPSQPKWQGFAIVLSC